MDEDHVAAVCFALGAVAGSGEDAELAAQRCLDAAYERVPYPRDAFVFRPLHHDTAHPAVQAELRWQHAALALLEQDGATPETINDLRL